jgi:hypothetical protein
MVNPLFAAVAIAGVLLPLLPTKEDRSERRLYWIGALVATVAAFFALYPPDWRGGLVVAGTFAGVLVLRAYMTTTYLVINGRTYSFNLVRGQPRSDTDAADDVFPDSYGGIATASKLWWLFVIFFAACSWIIVIFVVWRQGPWFAVGAAFALVLTSLILGHQDASWGYRVARGQWVQLVLVGVASIGIFPALYLMAYGVGTRWPSRTKRAIDYRTHPHLRSRYQ